MTEPKGRASWIHGEWAGLIAFVLALGISISMVVSLIGAVLEDGPIDQQKSNLLATVFGASIGVIGTYIGAHGRGGRRVDDKGNGAPGGVERRQTPR
jgi:hypothetical protein